jgi:hypothetical protein
MRTIILSLDSKRCAISKCCTCSIKSVECSFKRARKCRERVGRILVATDLNGIHERPIYALSDVSVDKAIHSLGRTFNESGHHRVIIREGVYSCQSMDRRSNELRNMKIVLNIVRIPSEQSGGR